MQALVLERAWWSRCVGKVGQWRESGGLAEAGIGLADGDRGAALVRVAVAAAPARVSKTRTLRV